MGKQHGTARTLHVGAEELAEEIEGGFLDSRGVFFAWSGDVEYLDLVLGEPFAGCGDFGGVAGVYDECGAVEFFCGLYGEVGSWSWFMVIGVEYEECVCVAYVPVCSLASWQEWGEVGAVVGGGLEGEFRGDSAVFGQAAGRAPSGAEDLGGDGGAVSGAVDSGLAAGDDDHVWRLRGFAVRLALWVWPGEGRLGWRLEAGGRRVEKTGWKLEVSGSFELTNGGIGYWVGFFLLC